MSLAGEPFISFGIVHVTTAAVTLCVAVFVPLMISRYATPNQQHWLRFALAGVVVFQLGINIWVRAGLFDLPLVQQLPLHLCGASLLISLLFLLFESYRAYEVAYFWAMAGGIGRNCDAGFGIHFPAPLLYLVLHGAWAGNSQCHVWDIRYAFPATTGITRQGTRCYGRLCALHCARQLLV